MDTTSYDLPVTVTIDVKGQAKKARLKTAPGNDDASDDDAKRMEIFFQTF